MILHVLLMGAVRVFLLGALLLKRLCCKHVTSPALMALSGVTKGRAQHFIPACNSQSFFIYLFKDRLHFENRSKKKKKKSEHEKNPKMPKKKPTHLCSHHFLGLCRSEYCLS